MRIDSFAKMPAMNFSSALSTFAGQNLGASREDRAKKGLKVTIIFTLIYSLFISLIIIILGKYIIRIFHTGSRCHRNRPRLSGYCFFILPAFFTDVCLHWVFKRSRSNIDSYAGNNYSHYTFSASQWPSFFLVKLAVNGIWWAEPTAWLAGMIILIIYYMSGKWRGKLVSLKVSPQT